MYCTAKLCFTSGSTCILRVSVKCFSFVLDSVTNSNILFFCLRWNANTPSLYWKTTHSLRRFVHTSMHIFILFSYSGEIISGENADVYSLKAGKGQEPLPTLQKSQSPRLPRGVWGLCGRSLQSRTAAEAGWAREPSPSPQQPGGWR